MNISRNAVRVACVAALGAGMVSVGMGAAQAAPATPQVAATTAVTAGYHQSDRQHAPKIVRQWIQSWNAHDGKRLGSLFTKNARYTDHAFDATYNGPQGVAQWVADTTDSIDNVHGELRWVHQQGREIAFGWTFSGHIQGAPSSFSVPAVTVLRLQGSKIATDDDYYSETEVLTQSGIPLTQLPPA